MDIHWISRDDNRFKITVEREEDLWYLSHVIEADDTIEGNTERKVDMGDTSKSKTVRKTFYLGIDVEDVSYDPSINQLRASGRITMCPDDISKGRYHSFNVSNGDTITVTKEKLTTYHVKKLEEATNPPSQTLLVLADRDRGMIARITPDGYEVITRLEGTVEKKAYEQTSTEDFHAMMAEKVRDVAERYDPNHIVLASPGFWKDNVADHLTMQDQNVILASVSRTDEQGFTELLGRGEVEQALESERSARETRIVKKLLSAIRDDKGCYGVENTKKYVAMGAVDHLLVTERFLDECKKNGIYDKVDDMMHDVEDMGGDVTILSGDEAMDKVDGLSGIAGVLRWKA